MSGWDVYENPEDVNWSKTNAPKVYFSKEDDGHQVKKGWVYAVPSGSIDAGAKDDDEEKYMYFNNSGVIVADQFKKINGKYYVFNPSGIMKTGVIVWCAAGRQGSSANPKYVDKLDLDWATGEELAKGGKFNLGKDSDNKDKYIYVYPDGKVKSISSNNTSKGNESPKVTAGEDILKLHLFGDDGARKTGMNTVEFSDDNYTFNTVGASGDKGSGVFAKKYYSLGILLKASQDIRYGIYQTATGSMLSAQSENWETDLVEGNYQVLTTSGSKQKGNKTAKKDADGNYWMINPTDSSLMGIYTVGIKSENSLSNFRTKTMTENDPWGTDDNPYADNETYITSEVARYYDSLFAPEYAGEVIGNSSRGRDSAGKPVINGVVWTKHHIANSNDCYFTINYTGPCFQSDYADGTNKWIPFGMLDNSLNSATFRFTTITDKTSPSRAYAAVDGGAFKPNNDYFLNCYWEVLR